MKMKSNHHTALYSVAFLIVMLLVTAIVLTIVFRVKRSECGHECESECSEECCDANECEEAQSWCEEQCHVPDPCPAPCPVPLPCPKQAVFTYCQNISNTSVACGNSSFGMTFDAHKDILVVSQQQSDNTSIVFIFKLDQQSDKPFYVLVSELSVQGIDPLVAVYDTRISVATAFDSKGMLFEYGFCDNQWSLISTANLNLSPTWISLFYTTTALVVDKIVYYYNNGITDSNSGLINAVSVSLDGDSENMYSLVGTYGASYLYCKIGIETGVGWGEPVRTFKQNINLIPNNDFGKFVCIKHPLLAIGDGKSVNVYHTNSLDCPVTCIIPPGMCTSSFSIYQNNVLVYGGGQVQMYSPAPKGSCETGWFKSYSINFSGASWIVAHQGATDNNLIITYGNDAQSQLNSYKQIL